VLQAATDTLATLGYVSKFRTGKSDAILISAVWDDGAMAAAAAAQASGPPRPPLLPAPRLQPLREDSTSMCNQASPEAQRWARWSLPGCPPARRLLCCQQRSAAEHLLPAHSSALLSPPLCRHDSSSPRSKSPARLRLEELPAAEPQQPSRPASRGRQPQQGHAQQPQQQPQHQEQQQQHGQPGSPPRPVQRAASPASRQLLAPASPRSLGAQAQLWQAQAEQDAASYGELLTLLRRSQCGVRAESLLQRLLQELGDLRSEALDVSTHNHALAVGGSGGGAAASCWCSCWCCDARTAPRAAH
jgi:hypothetical protein